MKKVGNSRNAGRAETQPEAKIKAAPPPIWLRRECLALRPFPRESPLGLETRKCRHDKTCLYHCDALRYAGKGQTTLPAADYPPADETARFLTVS